jgi:hypothetical protein
MNRHDRRAAGKTNGHAAPAQRPPAIMLGVPSSGVWKATMAGDAIAMAVWAAIHGIYIEHRGADGAYTEYNRNEIVRAALGYEHPIDALMWLDSDMRVPPQTLVRLWAFGKDIVGATYRERVNPYRYLGKFCDDADEQTKAGLKPMELMPGGVMLVRLDVYRAIPSPWYKLDEDGLRDDYYFTTKAREAGYKVWCDMELTRKVGHRGEIDIGWEWDERLVPRPDPRLKNFENPSWTGRAEPERWIAQAGTGV